MRQISIVNTTGLAHDTKIVDESTGVHLTRCTQEAVIRFVPQEAVEAEVTLGLIGAHIEGAKGWFYIDHPQTGDLAEVSTITLADGSVLEL